MNRESVGEITATRYMQRPQALRVPSLYLGDARLFVRLTAPLSVRIYTRRCSLSDISCTSIYLHLLQDVKSLPYNISQKMPFSNNDQSLDASTHNGYAHDNSATQQLEALFALAGDLATNQEATKIVSLFREGANLHDDVSRKTTEIAALKNSLKVMQKTHKDFREQQVETFETSQGKLRDQLGQRETEITTLTRDVAQKVSMVEELKGLNAKLKLEAEQLERLAVLHKAKAKADIAKIAELENLQKKAQQDHDSLSEQLQRERDQTTRLEANCQKLQQDFNALQKEHTSTARRWQLAQSLKVELSDKDPETLSVTPSHIDNVARLTNPKINRLGWNLGQHGCSDEHNLFTGSSRRHTRGMRDKL